MHTPSLHYLRPHAHFNILHTRSSTWPRMATENNDDNVPEEIEDTCIDCHHSLASVDRLLKPLLASKREDLEQDVSIYHEALHAT